MGRVTEVSVTYSRTVNLGNYESERLEVGQTSTVDEHETPESEIRELIAECKGIVRAHEARAVEQRREELERHWRGPRPKPAVDEEDDPTTGGL